MPSLRVVLLTAAMLAGFPKPAAGGPLSSYSRLLWDAVCWRAVELAGTTPHAIGYSGDDWTPSTFRQVLREGLYAPLVHTIAKNENLSLGAAYEQVKYLETAPPEILHWLLGRHVGAHHRNTPFISASARPSVAHSYSQRPGARSVLSLALAGHSGKPGVLFSIDPAGSRFPLAALEYQRSPQALSVQEIAWTARGAAPYHPRGVEIVAWLDQYRWLQDLDLHDHCYIFSVEQRLYDTKRALRYPEDRQKLVDAFERLFSDIFSEFHQFEHFSKLDADREYLLWIPPEKIRQARLFDSQGRVIEVKPSQTN